MASAILFSPPAMTFGIVELKCNKLFGSLDQAFPSLTTIGNIVGWIPGIGSITGAIRVYIGTQMIDPNDAQGDSIGKAFIVRGTAEIIGLGPLLLLIDLVITAVRCCFPRPNSWQT